MGETVFGCFQVQPPHPPVSVIDERIAQVILGSGYKDTDFPRDTTANLAQSLQASISPRRKANMPARKDDIESPSEEHISAIHNTRGLSNESHGDRTKKEGKKASTAALLRNPLTGMTREEILEDVDVFVQEHGLQEYRNDFHKGALIAQVNNIPGGFEEIESLNESEKDVLRRETTHKWSQPFMLYFLCTLCAGSAIVQGMDQTAVNGAQVSL